MQCRVCRRGVVVAEAARVARRCAGGGGVRRLMLHCLELRLEEEPTLCLACCGKLLAFSTFKCLALESDGYFRALENASKLEVTEEDYYFNKNMHQLELNSQKLEYLCPDNTSGVKLETEVYPVVKLEALAGECVGEYTYGTGDDSDDQLLSAIKHDLNANLQERKSKEQANGTKRKRGRPKSASQTRSKQVSGVCELCGKSVKMLAVHMKSHLPAGARKRVPCTHCGKSFATYSARYKHIKTKHLGIKPFCHICNKNVLNVRIHEMMMHNKEAMPFQCVVCGKKFVTKTYLDTHMTIHTKVKPFECSDCGKCFRLKGSLLNHQRRVHDGERPHMCQFCSKGFFNKSHLIKHIRVHTKEKPFVCDECNKRFACLQQLKVHIKRHRGIKDYPCGSCHMAFVTHVGLRAHSVTHTKEKRHACKYCGVRFGRSDHRNRHEQTAHEVRLAHTTHIAVS